METSWNVEACHELISSVYGAKQLELVKPTLASLAEHQTYSSYHYHEYLRIVGSITSPNYEQPDVLHNALGLMLDNRWNIRHPLTQASAHVMACIYSLHASLDTMALATYYAIGLNLRPKPLSEYEATLKNVVIAMDGEADKEAIGSHLKALQSAPALQHLSALSNQSKHRRVLYPSLGIYFREHLEEMYKMNFPEFTHRSRKYPAIDAKELLDATQEVLGPTLSLWGNSINEFLRSRR